MVLYGRNPTEFLPSQNLGELTRESLGGSGGVLRPTGRPPGAAPPPPNPPYCNRHNPTKTIATIVHPVSKDAQLKVLSFGSGCTIVRCISVEKTQLQDRFPLLGRRPPAEC